MSARQGKVTYSCFFRRKGAICREFMLEFGSFLRAVNDRPYEWMTMGCLEFDGDCHTSVRYFIAMTVLFDALASLYKFQFISLLF